MTYEATDLNLAVHRSSESVWERSRSGATGMTYARWLIGAAGVVLAVHGMKQRSGVGNMFAGVGGSLAYWALNPSGNFANVRRWIAQATECARSHEGDVVQQASDESFPASDAPSWTPTVGTVGRVPQAR